MRTLKLLFAFAFMVNSVFLVKAQGLSNINEANFFKAKYTKEKVWDAQRSPVNPVASKNWTLKGFKLAMDASNTPIAWGTDRYLMFVAVPDNANGVNSLTDNINNNGAKYNVSLQLFESNGTLVKVVSKWGNLIGQGDKGFMYVIEGKSGSFFSVAGLNTTSIVTYKPTLAKVSKLTEIISSSELVKVESTVGIHGNKRGVVKFFNEAKGFGFIVPDDGSNELFVHRSGIIGVDFPSLKDGQRVAFDIGNGQKGPQAINVQVL